MLRRLAILAATAVSLAGCSNVRDAFSAHADVVARAAGQELTVSRLAELLAPQKQVPLRRDVIDRVADLWVDYTLLAQSVAAGDSLTDTATAAKYAFGTVRSEGGKAYRYFQYDNGSGNVACVAGDPVLSLAPATNKWIGTCDVSDSNRNFVLGVALAPIADLSYGWIQTGGYYATVNTNGDDDIAKGDVVIASSTDKKCDSVATYASGSTIFKALGYAAAADVDADNTVAVDLTLDMP